MEIARPCRPANRASPQRSSNGHSRCAGFPKKACGLHSLCDFRSRRNRLARLAGADAMRLEALCLSQALDGLRSEDRDGSF